MLGPFSGPGPKSSHHLEHSEVPEGSSQNQVSERLLAAVMLLGSVSSPYSAFPTRKGPFLKDRLGVDRDDGVC